MATKSLKEVCKVDWGNTSLTKKSYVNNGEFLGVSAAGADGKMDHFEHEVGVTVISAIGANCGRIFFPEDKFTAIKNTITLTPKSDIIYPKYLFYSLVDNKFPKRGAGQPFITKGDVEKYQISFPPLPEQEHIVAILEKADSLRKKRQEANDFVNMTIESIFINMFGNPISNEKGWRIDDLGNLCNEFQNGIGKNKEFYGSGAKVANISDLYDECKFKPEKFSLLNVSDEEISKYKLNKGDIVFVRSSVKRTGVAYCSTYDSDELCLFSSFMIRAHPSKDVINSVWLSCCLRSKDMHALLVERSGTGTITNISQPTLKAIKVPVPPLGLQQKFADLVQKVEGIKEKQHRSEKELDNLFNCLMQGSFDKT